MERQTTLNGNWHYTPLAWTTLHADGSISDDTSNLPPAGEMKLPMNWQLRGLDSFDGRVRFTRTFEKPFTSDGERTFLVFRGIDYFADVTLNGHFLGRHAGYFQTFEFEIDGYLLPGENVLTVDVDCPKEEPGAVWPDHKWILKGILSHWDARPGSWDPETGQEKNSGGIWNDVNLEVRPAAFVSRMRAASILAPQEASTALFSQESQKATGLQALVRVEVEIDSTITGDFVMRLALDETDVKLPVRVTPGNTNHVGVVAVPNPNLWWPWDMGDPYLYELRTELLQNGEVVSRRQESFGIREIKLDPHNGQWSVNGKRFFVRGTNVVPTLWLGEYDEGMIGRDIKLLKEAHINGVRVCVHINRDEFYTACDRAGIIVWQDFALQWAYTTDHALTHEAVRQVQEMVDLLYNHPCIALWCTQNESSFHNRVVLNPLLAQAAAQRDSSRYTRATSEFSEHAYPGWYYGHLRDYLTLPGTPILTEFGAQALPSAAEVRQMRGGDQWPPDWDGLAYHDFQYNQTFNVANIETGDKLETFVENSQRYQADLLKFSIELYRRQKYARLGGMFQFMFMDCWPSITWSILSYDRVPKLGYHTLKQVYQPVLICTELRLANILPFIDKGSHVRPFSLQIWVINDRQFAIDGCTYQATLTNANGEVIAEATGYTEQIAADTVAECEPLLIQFPDDVQPGACVLYLRLTQADIVVSENSYALQLADLPKPNET